MNDGNDIRSFRDLQVGPKGIALTKEVHALTQRFPSDEKFGLVSQLRRAAVSVPSPIAEGPAGRSSAEFSQFLSVSLGSFADLETQLIIVRELQLATGNQVEPLIAQVPELQKMLYSLRGKPTTRH
jgi:four helix bundle protein